MNKLFRAAGTGLIAAVLTAQGIAFPVFAEDEQALRVISFSNVSTGLAIGEVPEYTAYLTGDALTYASILNEGWACTSDMTIHASKSEGLPVPDEPVGVPYSYLIALKADPGWYFPDDITLYYDSSLISSSSYTATVTNEGQVLMILCDFIPQVIPSYHGETVIAEVRIEDAVKEYAAGESPRFTAHTADNAGCSVLYERWTDELHPGHFVTSDESVNAEMMLADENRLTVFEANGQYRYDICLIADEDCRFAENLTVYVNGAAYQPDEYLEYYAFVNDISVIVPSSETVTTVSQTIAHSETTTTLPVATASETTVSAIQTPVFNPDLLYGDLNQDGWITVSDVVLLMRLLIEDSGISIPKDGYSAADINLDGILDMRDTAKLLSVLKTQTVTPPVRPPMYAEVSNSEEELPAGDGISWMLESDGNSAAFRESPIEGLTVSAEKNSLSYDGQLKFSELSDEEAEKLDTLISEQNWLFVDGWELDAGLGSDGHLPGSYTCEYDLTKLGIPEELYPQVQIVRIDDDGNMQQYAVERDGSTLRWGSDQNSYVTVVVTTLVVGGIIVAWANYDPDTIFGPEETKDKLDWYYTDSCSIRYADLTSEEDNAVLDARLLAAEQEAEKKARKEAEEEVENNWLAWSWGSAGYRMEVNRKTAKIKEKLLQKNEAYQADKALRNGVPADVKLLGDLFEKAYRYLTLYEGCPLLGYKPEIYYGSAVKGSGMEVNPKIGKAYLLINRKAPHTERVPKATASEDIYGKLVRKENADMELITMVHEVYHIMQDKKLSTSSAAVLKFAEMAAQYVEHRCVDYFDRCGTIQRVNYKDENIGRLETYGIPIDDSARHAQLLIFTGYTLAPFFEFLLKKWKVEITGWDLVRKYKKCGSLTELMTSVCGMKTSDGSSANTILAAFWKQYLKEPDDEFDTRARKVCYKNTTDDDEDGVYPSLMNRIIFSDKTTKYDVTVANRALTGQMTYIESPVLKFSVVLERNRDFGELQPEHCFIIPKVDGIPIGAECKNGVAMNTKGTYFAYREWQGVGNNGASGYTVHYIPAPDTPDVQLEDDNERLAITLKSAPSTEGAAGITDRFLLSISVNGKETCTRKIDFDDWAKPLYIPYSDLHLSMHEKNSIKITVCELIDEGLNPAGKKLPEFRTEESRPYETVMGESGFPEIEADFYASGHIGDISIDYEDETRAHFSLSKSGAFTFTMEDGRFPKSSNPFASGRLGYGSYSGFSVSGQASDTDDPAEWNAKIEKCSTNTFHAEYYYLLAFTDVDDDLPEVIVDGINGFVAESIRTADESEDEEHEIVVDGGFTGTDYGTLSFRYNSETGMVGLSISLKPKLKCTDTVNGKPNITEMTENSVEINLHFLSNLS